VSPSSGPVGTKTTLNVTGLPPSGTGSVEVDFVSVTGSRVNCTGTVLGLHLHVPGQRCGRQRIVEPDVTIPNNPGVNTLGGWHAIVLIKGRHGHRRRPATAYPALAASSRFKFPST